MSKFVVFGIAFNESKFLELAVSSWLSSDSVIGAVIVEGAVRHLSRFATQDGLSTDKTGDVLAKLKDRFGDRFQFERHGFAPGKRELQNRALKIIKQHWSPDWVIIAGCDELYKSEDLDKLSEFAQGIKRAGVILYPFYHFWRSPDIVATGSSWSVMMHRCYRWHPSMSFGAHQAVPTHVNGHKAKLTDIHVYHYTGMQNQDAVQRRLWLYQQRDGHRLNVKDTFSTWAWGNQTQWTHKGGSAERFTGGHPEIVGNPWELLPVALDGRIMIAPFRPWEKELIMDDVIVNVTSESLSNADYERLIKLIADEAHSLDVVTFDNGLVGKVFADHKIGTFKASQYSRYGVVINCDVPILAATRPRNVLLAHKDNSAAEKQGFVVVNPSGIETVGEFLKAIEVSVPQYKPVPFTPVPVAKKPTVRATPVRQIANVSARGLSGSHQEITLSNVSTRDIGKGDAIVARWLDSVNRQPIRGTAITRIEAPAIKRGKSKVVRVPIPKQPGIGRYVLNIDVETANGATLGIGTQILIHTR